MSPIAGVKKAMLKSGRSAGNWRSGEFYRLPISSAAAVIVFINQRRTVGRSRIPSVYFLRIYGKYRKISCALAKNS